MSEVPDKAFYVAQKKSMETMHLNIARTTDHLAAMQTGLESIMARYQAAAAPAAAPEVDHMLVQIMLHARHGIPEPTKFTNRALMCEPYGWLRIMQLRQPALTSDAIMDSDELPGVILQAFHRAMVMHFPLATETDLRDLDEAFVALARGYLAGKATVATPPQAGQWEAAAKMIVRDTIPIIVRTRRLLVKLEKDAIRATHGDVSARLYEVMETDMAPGQHNMSAITAKQVIYASTVGKRTTDRGPGGGGGGGGDRGGGASGMATCRFCKEKVTPGAFKEHNEVCKRAKKKK